MFDEVCMLKIYNDGNRYEHHFRGQNMNNCMMQYLAWRVATGRYRRVEINFLIAGHTKFAVEYEFGHIKKKYRVTKVCSLDEIKQVRES